MIKKIMPIIICLKCKKPIPDGFHDFKEVCNCVDWGKVSKEKGWKIREG